ncbi:MAG TPA: hypothetical protein DDY14_01110 [Chromatiaceae bacterium]|jgi:hypothetical protein|nr:MAG: hypothetical protein N838_19120 [Thiohalocapsa sp. PB-PSB1]QQO55690.1 MAG: hypothetical protein N838_22405 [Thiohalocapsa sp. PB-PSB1]HBG93932.1 hypothetical protein [Chromatiaceae bacterium]HCS88740.1 hypothetical protein [Chromatiaceae bacterium]
MTDNADLIDYLTSIGADEITHSRRTLLTHLRGVQGLLEDWGMTMPLCQAGLFHSVYGTEYFHGNPVAIDQRDRVRDLIGSDSEQLVWLWHVSKRSEFRKNLTEPGPPKVVNRLDGKTICIDDRQWTDLVTLMIADLYEQMPHRHIASQLRTRHRLRPFLAMAPTKAQQELSRYFERELGMRRLFGNWRRHLRTLAREWRKT